VPLELSFIRVRSPRVVSLFYWPCATFRHRNTKCNYCDFVPDWNTPRDSVRTLMTQAHAVSQKLLRQRLVRASLRHSIQWQSFWKAVRFFIRSET